jgi:hypothetical protein
MIQRLKAICGWWEIRKRTKMTIKTIVYRTLEMWSLKINILDGEETWTKWVLGGIVNQ